MLPDGSPLASPADAGGYGAPAEMEMPSSPWGGMAGGSSDAYQPEGGPGYRAEDYQQGYGEDSQSSPPDDAYAGSRESDAPEKQARHQDHSPVEYDASGPGTYGSGSAPPAGSPPPGYASSYEGPDSGEHQGSAGYPEESGGGYSGSPQVTQEMVYYCTNCNKELPDHIDVGDRCPHCRAYLSYEEGPDGTVTKRSARGFYTGLVNLVVGVVLLISAVGGLMRLIRR